MMEAVPKLEEPEPLDGEIDEPEKPFEDPSALENEGKGGPDDMELSAVAEGEEEEEEKRSAADDAGDEEADQVENVD
ncbi:unnamed protein product [Durusdinium trenchii]|uniref:Uncharacterized protein n=1 Tax=Durusdinium trenchii TaxID=1381693 RepID=A0ABP0RV22_9DINO